jgi:digeranylgeranylglycerophospholipid reductase
LDQTEVLVIGAGPGGSTAARFAAEAGADVTVLDKRSEIGEPVQCAEGIPQSGLDEIGIGEGPWIARKIDNVKLYSPSGIELDISNNVRKFEFGYVLERKIFDKHLARLAADAGAKIKLCCKATALRRENGRAIVTYEEFGDQAEIQANIVIGADGVMSKVGRWAGMNTNLDQGDIESGAEYEMINLELDDEIELYFGECYAPGGCAWIFPKGDDKANVGLAVIPKRAKKPAIEYLNDFLKHPLVSKRLENGSIIEVKVGGVPVSGPPQTAVSDNVMLVGDAARQVNPITGGGIHSSSECGKIAGRIAAKVAKGDDFSAEALKPYDKEWIEAVGNYHWKLLKAKNVFLNLSDKELDQIATAFLKAGGAELNTMGILKAMSSSSPRLLWKLRKAL